MAGWMSQTLQLPTKLWLKLINSTNCLLVSIQFVVVHTSSESWNFPCFPKNRLWVPSVVACDSQHNTKMQPRKKSKILQHNDISPIITVPVHNSEKRGLFKTKYPISSRIYFIQILISVIAEYVTLCWAARLNIT